MMWLNFSPIWEVMGDQLNHNWSDLTFKGPKTYSRHEGSTSLVFGHLGRHLLQCLLQFQLFPNLLFISSNCAYIFRRTGLMRPSVTTLVTSVLMGEHQK